MVASSRWTPTARSTPASERTVLTVDQPYANHNGGNVVFGPDGYLYIGLGDGGAASDPRAARTRPRLAAGQDPAHRPRRVGRQRPYTVPADNPFVGVAGARPEIWSYGVRNPWRFDFDPATGDLWIADVGQNQWEEIDLSPGRDGAGRA